MSEKRKSRTVRAELAVIVVLVLVAAGLGAALLTKGGDDNGGDQQSSGDSPAHIAGGSIYAQQPVGPLGEHARRHPGAPMARGAADAPVVLITYSDLRCPFCAKFSRDTEPQLIDRYVNSGKLRIEWRDFPVFGDQSISGARAGRAAADQGKFWQFIGTVYEHAPATGHPDLTPQRLVEYAQAAGVPDIPRFRADMASSKYDAAITADAQEAIASGFSGTPSFSVNGYPIIGAQPLPMFHSVIDGLLEGQGK